MFRNTTIVLVGTALVCWLVATTRDDVAVSGLGMELDLPPVFVGEMPLIRVTLTAADDREITLLRPDFWRPTHRMVVGLTDPQGRTESFGPPPDIMFPSPLPPVLEARLGRRKSITANVPSFLWPRSAGKHQVTVLLWPHPDRKGHLEAAAPLEVLPLDEKHVLQRISLSADGKTKEILSATDGSGVIVLCVDPAVNVVDRLGVFEVGARVTAQLDETKRAKPRIAIQVDEAQSVHVLIVDFAKGRMVWPYPPPTTAQRLVEDTIE